jgi:hypothetical protein
MTAVILPFVRPAARAKAHSGRCSAAILPLPSITSEEQKEALSWASALGLQWRVELVTAGPYSSLVIHTPRCAASGTEEGEQALPWEVARTEDGIVVLEDGWLEQGTFHTVMDALAQILELETLAGWMNAD